MVCTPGDNDGSTLETTTTIVDPSKGTITITKTEKRYPQASSLLMGNGFIILLFNMGFGLLPTTLYGDRLKYMKCSIAQAYNIIFGLCMVILSIFFVPVTIIDGIVKDPSSSSTASILMIMIKITHVLGFLLLLVRASYVAKKMPQIWSKLAQLLQISIIEVYGKKCKLVKGMTNFVIISTIVYVGTIAINEMDVFLTEIHSMVPQFMKYYDLPWMIPPEQGGLNSFNRFAIVMGYVMWKLCSFSHILVSVIVGYMIVTITVCIKAGNNHLVELFETELLLRSGSKGQKVKILKTLDIEEDDDGQLPIDTFSGGDYPMRRGPSSPSSSKLPRMLEEQQTGALNRTKDIAVISESVCGSISKYFGVSLIIEVLILMANVLVNVYSILVPFRPAASESDGGNGNYSFYSAMNISSIYSFLSGSDIDGGYDDMTGEWKYGDENIASPSPPMMNTPAFSEFITLVAEAFIHSYFFYKLCCLSTDMVNESQKTLQIVKSIPYKNYGRTVERQIQQLKGDLASSEVVLSATSYFRINKFTLTSVTSALTTYIVVLLQFQAQEIANNGCKDSSNESDPINISE